MNKAYSMPWCAHSQCGHSTAKQITAISMAKASATKRRDALKAQYDKIEAGVEQAKQDQAAILGAMQRLAAGGVVACDEVAARRLLEVFDHYGAETVLACIERFLEESGRSGQRAYIGVQAQTTPLSPAQRTRAGFALTDADRPAISRICRQVEGMPLGIELAAAWVQSFSCGEIARKIEAGEVLQDENIARVAVVGIGMKSHPGVAAKMFGTLAENKINIEMIATSEISISCIIKQDLTDSAVKTLHQAFKLDLITG